MSVTDVNIAFRGLDHSDAVEERIREELDKLAKVHGRITGGTVRVEQPGHGSFSLHLNLTVPGAADVVVSHEPGKSETHSDVYRTVKDAFAAARRQLKGKGEKLRGRVKSHKAPGGDVPAGSISV